MIGKDPLVLLMLGLMGTFLLRAVGVIGAGHLQQDSPLFRWIGCVAFAIAAGIMSKIILIPSGVLAETPITARIGGAAVGLLIFFGIGRRIHLGLAGGLLAFLLIGQLPFH